MIELSFRKCIPSRRTPNGIPFYIEQIRKGRLQSNLALLQQDTEIFFSRVHWKPEVKATDRKNNSNQTYSCRRDWQLLASLEQKLIAPWNPSDHHSPILSRTLRGALHWAPIMPKDASLSDSGCIYFQAEPLRMLFTLHPNKFTVPSGITNKDNRSWTINQTRGYNIFSYRLYSVRKVEAIQYNNKRTGNYKWEFI